MSKVFALPPALVERAVDEDVRDEVAAMKGATQEQLAKILEDLCRMAAELTAQHADPQRVLDWQDPISPETEALLERLRETWARHG